MNKCVRCGTELPYEPPGTAKELCPTCKVPTSRTFSRGTFESVATPTDEVTWAQTRQGTNSVATLDSDGAAALKMTGKPPRNEQDADVVSARLVRALNASGSSWG